MRSNQPATDSDYRATSELGAAICEGQFSLLQGVPIPGEILMPYQQ
jgi:hypothetical protein